MTGARESTDEEHDEHADSQPGGGRPPLHPHLRPPPHLHPHPHQGGRPALHPHLRPLHRQRLRPHVLALWPLLVLHHPHLHIYLNLIMSCHMVTFLRETLIMESMTWITDIVK